MAAKKTAKKKTTASKADFVRSLPLATSGKDAVAKAKAAGIALTEAYVYKIRTLDKKGTKGKKAAGKKSAKKAATPSPKTRGRSPDKRNHVLKVVAENPTWSAEQVAKAVKCSKNYVYSVWGKAQPRGNGTASGDKRTTEFYRVLKRVGVPKAKELIANIEAYENA